MLDFFHLTMFFFDNIHAFVIEINLGCKCFAIYAFVHVRSNYITFYIYFTLQSWYVFVFVLDKDLEENIMIAIVNVLSLCFAIIFLKQTKNIHDYKR
jgi:hypothetical protein